MTNKPWRILLVEDDEDDYVLTSAWLSLARGSQFVLDWVSNYNAAIEAVMNREPDAILIDYDLGARNGLELTRELIQQGRRIPIILLTGRGSYEIDLEAMRAGATDYLTKGEMTPLLLERTIRYAIERSQREVIIHQANEQLAASNALLAQAKDELEIRVQERTQELKEAYDQLRASNALLAQSIEELRAEISERKRTQAELAELQRRLLDSVEAERLQLAQDLHDGPMQELYGLAYQLGTLGEDLQPEVRDALVASLQSRLQQVIQSLRVTAGELRPPSLAQFGLEKAIRSHADRFQEMQPGLQIYMELMPDRRSLPERVRMALFRIYQVAFTNVVRHSGASRVDIRLHLNSQAVVLEIQDDGCGFQVPKRWIEMARKGHLGLVGAAERAEAVGGEIMVESAPGKGTLIRVTVPVENKNT